jgi:hypothetical protein
MNSCNILVHQIFLFEIVGTNFVQLESDGFRLVWPKLHGEERKGKYIIVVFFNKWMIFGEKIELIVYVNQHDFVSDIQTPSRSWFLLCFLHELWTSFTNIYITQKSEVLQYSILWLFHLHVKIEYIVIHLTSLFTPTIQSWNECRLTNHSLYI